MTAPCFYDGSQDICPDKPVTVPCCPRLSTHIPGIPGYIPCHLPHPWELSAAPFPARNSLPSMRPSIRFFFSYLIIKVYVLSKNAGLLHAQNPARILRDSLHPTEARKIPPHHPSPLSDWYLSLYKERTDPMYVPEILNKDKCWAMRTDKQPPPPASRFPPAFNIRIFVCINF